jgi:hydrogenase nickel incorporation protein HypA/HybF
MHEMSLAEGVLGVVQDAARVHQPCTVRTVRLEIGALAAVECEALRFAFEVVKRGSVADGARLDIVQVPGSAWCMQCSRTVAIGSRGEPCPECGGWQLQVTAGGEMRVMELELA